MTNKIINDVIKSIRELGKETLEKSVEETGIIAETIITGKELLGDIVPMSSQEMEQKKMEDEKKKQKEIADMKAQMSEHGRNVEGEINKIRQEKEQKEKEEERLFLENLKRQREEERLANESFVFEESSNPGKRKKSRGSAFAGKAKKEDMSATKEYVKKPD